MVSAVVAQAAVSTVTPGGGVALGTWTILGDGSDLVRAVVTRERDRYVVRDDRGVVLGRYVSAQEALASVTA